MLVFVDESGDAGMEMKPGSTRHFVVAAVIFDRESDALACDHCINEVREVLRLSQGAPFHFCKTSHAHREAFLQAMAKQKFIYQATVVDKKSFLPGPVGKESFYQQVVGVAFRHLRPRLHGAHVAIHRSGGLDFGRRLCKYISQVMNGTGGREIVKQVRMAKSENDNLIQLADMVCGAVARSFRDDRNDRDCYRKLIRRRESDVKLYP
jgi:hypothetical protein